jgi:hypothetical protein
MQAPPAQAAASGHLVAQSPQCEALLCVSTHSLPQTTPLLHISGAPPVPAPDSIVLPAAPAVPAPELPNKSREPLPQWTSPRTASRITRQRRAPCAALQAEPPLWCSLDGLVIEIEDGRIRLKPKREVSQARGSISRAATRSRCLSKSI